VSRGVIFHGIRSGDRSPRAGREGFELWGVTRAAAKYAPGELDDWTRWFDTHTFEAMGLWPGLKASREQTIEWYKREPANGRPIYMQRADPEIPASRAYPLAEVQAAFPIDEGDGPIPNRMFGCMVDYLFGLALMEGLAPIVLNGIGMSHDAGHQYVHRTTIGWIQFARGRGVQVIVEGASCYRNAGRQLYGYERYGYEELDQIMASYPQTPSTPDTDLAALFELVESWRTVSKSSVQCATELDHLLAALQRLHRQAVV
jgi:hypothetical protein